MDDRVIKARFREPRLIRQEGEDKLDETPLLVGNLRFCNKNFLAGEERRARMVSKSYGNQAQPYGRFLGRILPAELSFSLPACTANTVGGQEKQGCHPVSYLRAKHALLPGTHPPSLRCLLGGSGTPAVLREGS